MTTTACPTAEQILSTGLYNQWYALCPSDAIDHGAIVPLRRFGEDWVAFREAGGSVRVLEDRCPHRGAPLSLGSHLGDRISCRYHGIEVDGGGTVVTVPGMPGCAMEGRTHTRSLPVREHAGAVFVYRGDELHPDPSDLEFPTPLASDEYSHFLCYTEWKSPWRFAVENVADPMHGAFLHRESHSMFDGDTQAKFQVTKTDKGFVFEKVDQRDVNFDWVEVSRTGADWLELEIPYPPSGGPGGSFGIVGTVVPIDADRTALFFWRYRKVSGWQRDVWRFLYRTTLEPRHWQVLEQDRLMLEAMAADADRREHLYQHDLGLVRLRKLYRHDAKEQAEALAAAAG